MTMADKNQTGRLENMQNEVLVKQETWTIPTYTPPEPLEMPMFAEYRQHQGTTGNPYPSRIVNKVNHKVKVDRTYDVIRLENEYIRLIILPEIGGRIFEAYDKVNDYHFLYRQHVIKPALIGCHGLWISGGLEFNWPFHHRPSTFMPVDYTIEQQSDGSAVVWLSEHDPADRTKGMVGIVLHPDKAWFETRMQITNRTKQDHSFMWWENAAVSVHEDYQLIFPPDVTWVHHHYDKSHATYPLAYGQYGAEKHHKPTDISWHGHTRLANSYFAAPSRYNFFGGYDHRRHSGVLHIANHHISPGKKMFTWGYGRHADNWEQALTDDDGTYAELMAGSYTDDQPDFTWIEPYETKCFSQYWYPISQIGHVSFANLEAAVALDRDKNELRLLATEAHDNLSLTVQISTVQNGQRKPEAPANQTSSAKNEVDPAKEAGHDASSADSASLFSEQLSIRPGQCLVFAVNLPETACDIKLADKHGRVFLYYQEQEADRTHMPADNPGIQAPAAFDNPQSLYLMGLHIEQYRDPSFKADAYYEKALEKDPAYLPALVRLANFNYKAAKFAEAMTLINRAEAIASQYNQNHKSGSIRYLQGLLYFNQDATDLAYDAFYKAAWSADCIAPAMAFLAAIDCQRGDYSDMLIHAGKAYEKENKHPLAMSYAAVALTYQGKQQDAVKLLWERLGTDPLDHLARFLLVRLNQLSEADFFQSLNSDPSQTCLDIAFDLLRAGLNKETIYLLEKLQQYHQPSAMVLYLLADCLAATGQQELADQAAKYDKRAAKDRFPKLFPYSLEEISLLRRVLVRHPEVATADYLLGCILYDRKQYKQAASCWERAIAHDPEFYIPYRNLAIACYSHLNAPEQARILLQKAIELQPHHEQLLIEISHVMARLGVNGEERLAYLNANQPQQSTDALQLEKIKACHAAGRYDEALALMTGHVFSPGEGEEFIIADQYMFNRMAAARLAFADGDSQKALACFQAALKIPENMHAGFWNLSVTVPYRYFEAAVLMRLNQNEAAKEIFAELAQIENTGMWHLGSGFTYYSAQALKLSGENMAADQNMRQAIMTWEKDLASLDQLVPMPTPFFQSMTDDPRVNQEAELHAMLGFGRLYFGQQKKAAEHFARSLHLNPDQLKIAFELRYLQTTMTSKETEHVRLIF